MIWGSPMRKLTTREITNKMPDIDFYIEWQTEQSRKREAFILSQSSQVSAKPLTKKGHAD